MIPKECKRLAEVDFPIAVVSKHAAREKSIRHGHPSTLHLWWARRPLAACRAMLLGLLLPDPCDEHCPEKFKKRAGELLPRVQGKVGSTDEDIRNSLLKFIGDFSDWHLSGTKTYLEVSRELVKAAHGEEPLSVIDPFAGGGSIPLEALRLNSDVFANDLNPIPWLLSKVLLDDAPRFGSQLIERFTGALQTLRVHLQNSVGRFYPANSSDEEPTAYLWARTVSYESPHCGATIPLLRSSWLSRSRNESWVLRIAVERPETGTPQIRLIVESQKREIEPRKGTIMAGRAVCPACSATLYEQPSRLN